MTSKNKSFFLIVYFGSWLAYFLYFWRQALHLDKVGNLVAGHVSIWGDWAAHFTMGSSMAERSLLLPQSPLLINAKFSYPFISNMISAILIRASVSFTDAFVLPSFFFSLILVFVLYIFYKTIFNSRKIAIIASLIFLLNGGVGFIYFFQDIANSTQPLQVFFNPPVEYTSMQENHIRWISVINSMVIPQRAFNHGFPLTLITLTLIYSVKEKLSKKVKKISKKDYLKILTASTLLGIMPLIHTHSFLAAFLILGFWSGGDIIFSSHKQRLNKIKVWILVLVITSLISLPLLRFFFFEQVGSNFIKWFPGWYLQEFTQLNWFVFWFKNWGIVPVLSLLGLWLLIKKLKTLHLKLRTAFTFLPFFLLFTLMNLWLFQPFIWDNTKILVWASVGISGLTGYLFVSIWNHASTLHAKPKTYVLKTLVVITFFLTILSGLIDTYRITRFPLHQYQMYSHEELELVEWVKNNTDKNSIWLTGDQHNHWLFNLTGRQALITYRGWMWTHGYDYRGVESDVSLMFQNPTRQDLFSKYRVNYIVIGPNEKNVWKADESIFREEFKIIRETNNYLILSQ